MKWKRFQLPPDVVKAAIVTALPVLMTYPVWISLWRGSRSRSWDGSGHFAVAEIYSRTVFPDTFGWTNAFFGGMPLPNFYPPLFYWLVAAFNHAGLSFPGAFKLVLAGGLVAVPLAVWMIGRTVIEGEKSIAAAFWSGTACLPLLLDARFHQSIGLTYQSTFHVGLYTQPLGFVLFACWFALYRRAHLGRRAFIAATFLLGLTVLANFFNAVTAAVFIASTVFFDVIALISAKRKGEERNFNQLLAHTASPVLAFGLALFWVCPMILEYDYFVTRPFTLPLKEMVTPGLWGWYVAASYGMCRMWKHRTNWSNVYLCSCGFLAFGILFGAFLSPRWFPLQATRFLTTLNFLLAVPIGFGVSEGVDRLSKRLRINGSRNSRRKRGKKSPADWTNGIWDNVCAKPTWVVSSLLVLALCLNLNVSFSSAAFIRNGQLLEIDSVLDFAREHRDGRYLVEFPLLSQPAAVSGRMLTSYLGAQGNESLNVVFREAAPNSIFFNPLITAFSASPDSFGLSSVLSDDLDFLEQPLSRHIERARFVGVEYLVIVTPWIKERLRTESKIVGRNDFGPWTIFEIQAEPTVKSLPYRPALVVSPMTFKLRWSGEYNFTRLAEEQFADGWFEIMLAGSPERAIERLPDLDQFGALVLDTYETDDINRAYEVLRTFSRNRAVVLLSSKAPLFKRIQANLHDFPKAEIVNRSLTIVGNRLDNVSPGSRYGSSDVRLVWLRIREILEMNKVPTQSPTFLEASRNESVISITSQSGLPETVPVLIKTSFHPNWRRADQGVLFPMTPFFMMTFLPPKTDGTISLNFERNHLEYAALGLSAILAAILVIGWFFPSSGRTYRSQS